MEERFERIIEHEIDFYLKVEEYEKGLLERYYESQLIEYSVTTFDEEQGRVYLSGLTTEDQVIRRLESKTAIENLLKRAVSRINRLNRSLAQLTPEELNVISIYYFEGFTSELRMSRTLGYRTVKEFICEKDRVLRKVYSYYQEERDIDLVDTKIAAKEELKRKAKQWHEHFKAECDKAALIKARAKKQAIEYLQKQAHCGHGYHTDEEHKG